jgi:serine/threonine protein kinase/tetratricopeptide (TPR) repeat protein
METTIRQLDEFVEAFELARQHSAVDLANFLPPHNHPLYLPTLRELVRVDLELGWEAGQPRPLDDYREQFPELFEDAISLQEVAYEEYRLRRAAGKAPVPADYESRYGVNTAGWASPQEHPSPAAPGPCARLEDVARSYHDFRLRKEPAAGSNGNTRVMIEGAGAEADFLRDLQRSDPAAADRFAEGLTSLPEVGDEFLGFRLVAELGRGAFGRVFLAQQGALADRPVALKIAADVGGESRALAQLQHTHVVPIYSVHNTGCLSAVCMPYLGCTTLADVLRELRGQRALPLSGLDLFSARRQRPGAPVNPEAVAAGLKRMAALSSVEAALWLAACLADGLAHAHERGILHRDLKPANVLLGDDGLPMLLDFNLAEDVKQGASGALLGGTLPYMAPEHLRAARGEPFAVDERSDVYSLGLILYELLTGQAPFPSGRPETGATPSALHELVDVMIAERSIAPDVRAHNRALSPAVAAVVRRCLEPSPERRYQTARQFQEDLQCQLEHRPLRHASEPSVRERTRKWLKRHPRFWLHMTGVAAVFLLLLAGGLAFHLRATRQAREAEHCLEQFRDEARLVQFLLTTQQEDRAQQADGAGRCRAALDRYQVLTDKAWRRRPLVTALPPAERTALEGEVGELLLLLSRAVGRAAAPGSPDETEQLREALGHNERAESCFPPEEAPPVLWRQRADLLRRLGETDEASACAARGQEAPRTLRDSYLEGWGLLTQRKYADAVAVLEPATRRGAQHFWTWFLLGLSYDALGDDAGAVRCYTAASTLAPNFHGPFVNRGLVYARQNEAKPALADFNRAIELCPERADTYFDRALVLARNQGKYQESIADLTRALELGTSATRVYFVRSRYRRLAGDHEGARRDHEEGLRRRPTDARSWVARGLARAGKEPLGALADFDEALALSPTERSALQSKAAVLAENLPRPAEALQVLDRLLTLYPSSAQAYAGRAVLRGRLGQRAGALDDAREALRLDGGPAIRYQAACAYALTSRQQPADAHMALTLLREALEKNYGLEFVARDPDLDPLRALPAFRRLADAAASALVLRQRLPPPRNGGDGQRCRFVEKIWRTASADAISLE